MTMEFESIIGLGALPIVVLVLTEHVKQFFRAVHDRNRADAGASPWPLVADGIGMGFAMLSWTAGYVPAVDSYLGASLVGLAASLVVQGGYQKTRG